MGLGMEDVAVKAIATQPDWVAWSKMPADDLLARLVNDLEAPAFAIQPALKKLRTDLQRVWNGKIVRMSGSGSTLFTLCDDAESAKDLASRANSELRITTKVVQLAPVGT
jgi:4-diphosphocytidyl-2C-methyl-D-erythritol kinase